MSKDATDFMIEEYDRISDAFFGLRDQVNEWFKSYLTLVGLPLTVLVAVIKLSESELTVSIEALPDLVSGLLVLVAGLGCFMVLSIVAMRLEMIWYARTMNGVRRYFGELDQAAHGQGQSAAQRSTPELAKYFMLPTSDAYPPFFEPWRAIFWQVLIIGVIDGVIAAVGLHSLVPLIWLWSIVLGAGYCLAHLGVYYWLAKLKKSRWTVRFEEDLKPSKS